MSLAQFVSHLRFLRDRPRVAVRLANNLYRAFVLKKPRMKNLELAVTYRCDQNCEMCSATTLHRTGAHTMSVEEIIAVVQQCKRLGLVHVDLTGGEPLCRPFDELLAIVRGLSAEKDLIVAVATNGQRATRERLMRLQVAGLTQILFNLQSSDPELHDKIVGIKGSYYRAVRSLLEAKRLGLTICVNTVIGRHNFDDIVALGEKCKQWGVFLALNLAASAGEWKNETEQKFTRQWYSRYSAFLRQKHVRSDNIFNFKTLRWGCPGGIEKVYITEYGEVLQCPFVHVSYGNVLREPVERIFKRMATSPFIAYYSERCKHVFSERFKRDWLAPLENCTTLPLPYKEHPYFRRTSSSAENAVPE